jgi:hypothetical protein
MTDGQWLFATFFALYLLESLRWLPPHTVLLVGSGRAGGWRWVRPSATFRLRGRGALFLPLWPPLPTWRLTSEWALVPSPETLDAAAEDTQLSALAVPWAQLTPAAIGADLQLTPATQLPLANEAEALRWAALLQQWQGLAPAARAAAFAAEAQRSLDPVALQEGLHAAEQETRWLRRLGGFIALWCYGVIAGLYWRFGESSLLLVGVAVLVGLMLTQAVLFGRLCKKRARCGEPPVPWWRVKAVGILLFPPMAIRAADALLSLQAPWFHPLASRQLVADKTWHQAALSTWRAAVYRPGWQQSPPGIEAQLWRRHFTEAGITIDPLDAPPEPPVPAYCPRCRAVFTAETRTCADCGGVALVHPSQTPTS